MTTQLIFSIDTEVSIRNKPSDTPDVQILGRCGDARAFGIQFIIDQLKPYGWDATFFLNIFDEHLWPADTYSRIGDIIRTAGSDLQLHTHVEQIAGFTGHTRDHLSEYDLDWQTRILQHGSERFRALTGAAPSWHRSGNLAANSETLRACAASGLIGDSSFAYGWPACRTLPIPDQRRNALQKIDGTYELPVTTIGTLHGFGPSRHFDINNCTFDELTHVTKQAVRAGTPYLVMLMHSFSFVDRAARAEDVQPRDRDINRFARFLEFAAQTDGLDVTTFNRIPLDENTLNIPDNDPIQLRTGLRHTFYRAWMNRHRGWKNLTFVVVVLSLLVLLAAAATLPLLPFITAL